MASADAPSSKSNQESSALDLNSRLRKAMSNAYALVVGSQATQSLAALTYEELADAQIERIEGPGTQARPGELERLARIERDFLSAVEQIRKIPPDRFLLHDESSDVNTDPGST